MAANAVLTRLPRSKWLWLTKALHYSLVSTCRCIPAIGDGPSAANLKFLSVLLRANHRNFKFKAALESNMLLELL